MTGPRLDLVLRQVRLAGDEETPVDIAIDGGRIVDIGQRIETDAREEQVDGRVVFPGFVESEQATPRSANQCAGATPRGRE